MSLNKLQNRLVGLICGHLKEKGYPGAYALKASTLSAELNVSRTPVRAALEYLCEVGVAEHIRNRGYFTKDSNQQLVDRLIEEFPVSQRDLYVVIAEDRVAGKLPDIVNEAYLMRRYDVDRMTLQGVLTELENDGLLFENPGRGWKFEQSLNTTEAYEESYNYRKLILGNCLFEPTMQICHDLIAESRQQHEALMASEHRTVQDITNTNFFFYEVVARCSGNRFVVSTIQQQDRIRRFQEFQFDWANNPERLQQVYSSHMQIFDAIEAGNVEQASKLLWLHLDAATNVGRPALKSDTAED